jgi:hypothetical protein
MPNQRVDFTEVNNPMLRFLLDDGTEICIKVVMMGVVRCDELLPDGQHRHELKMQTLIDQLAPAGEIDVRKLVGSK